MLHLGFVQFVTVILHLAIYTAYTYVENYMFSPYAFLPLSKIKNQTKQNLLFRKEKVFMFPLQK